MKAILVMSACLALANCEAPTLGYQYTNPVEAPARISLNNLSGGIASSSFSVPQQYQQHSQQYEYQGQQYAQQFQQPAQQYIQQYTQQYQQPAQQFIQQYQQPAQQFIQQYHQPALQYSQLYTQQYQQPAEQYSQQYAQQYQQQQVAQVHKHVYVHVAPEEQEPTRVRNLPLVAPPQKHYKIHFIKAPSAAPASSQLVLPQQSQSEEKTIVYVLSKNTEGQQPLVLPSPAATAPSKPEVYFVKYNTQKEQSSTFVDSSQFDQAGGVEDPESVAIDSTRSGQPVPARFAASGQLSTKYGTPEIQ